MLPRALRNPLARQIATVRRVHEEDLRRGYGEVYLPYALERKYKNAARDFIWQYLFPADKLSVDPRSGKTRRHHVSEQNVQRAVKTALRAAGIKKNGTCHAFRHSFATHLLEDGYDIPREINNEQVLLRLRVALTQRQHVLRWFHEESQREIGISQSRTGPFDEA